MIGNPMCPLCRGFGSMTCPACNVVNRMHIHNPHGPFGAHVDSITTFGDMAVSETIDSKGNLVSERFFVKGIGKKGF